MAQQEESLAVALRRTFAGEMGVFTAAVQIKPPSQGRQHRRFRYAMGRRDDHMVGADADSEMRAERW